MSKEIKFFISLPFYSNIRIKRPNIIHDKLYLVDMTTFPIFLFFFTNINNYISKNKKVIQNPTFHQNKLYLDHHKILFYLYIFVFMKFVVT